MTCDAASANSSFVVLCRQMQAFLESHSVQATKLICLATWSVTTSVSGYSINSGVTVHTHLSKLIGNRHLASLFFNGGGGGGGGGGGSLVKCNRACSLTPRLIWGDHSGKI